MKNQLKGGGQRHENQERLLCLLLKDKPTLIRFIEDGHDERLFDEDFHFIIRCIFKQWRSGEHLLEKRPPLMKYAADELMTKQAASAQVVIFNKLTFLTVKPSEYPTLIAAVTEQAERNSVAALVRQFEGGTKDDYAKAKAVIDALKGGLIAEAEAMVKLRRMLDAAAVMKRLRGQRYEPTDLGNAQLFADAMRGRLRYVYGWKGWIAWDGKRWGRNDSAAKLLAYEVVKDIMPNIGKAIENDERRAQYFKWVGSSQARNRIENMLALAAPMLNVATDELDADAWLFNVQNGTINLRTGNLRPHDANDLLTNISAVKYDASAACPTWTASLERILSNPNSGEPRHDLIAFVQRAAGYSLTGVISGQCFFVLHGAGQNGKSKLIDALMYVVGDYGIVGQQSLLIADRHRSNGEDEAQLFGRRMVVCSETSKGASFDEAKIKRLTGNGTIRARRLYENSFEFHATHKLWLDCNHRPKVSGADFAMKRRVMLIPFDVIIPSHERDDNIADKFRAEASGILNWMLQGLAAWRESGLQPPSIVTESVNEYMSEHDLLGHFLSEHTADNPIGKASARDLYYVYTSWCKANGIDYPLTQQSLGRELKQRGYEQQRSASSRCWAGLELVGAEENEDEDAEESSFAW